MSVNHPLAVGALFIGSITRSTKFKNLAIFGFFIIALLMPMAVFGKSPKVKAKSVPVAESVTKKGKTPTTQSKQKATGDTPVDVSSLALLTTLQGWKNNYALTGAGYTFPQLNFGDSAIFSECPDGFKSLGGNIISDPTAATFKDKVFVFVRGTDMALYYQVFEKGTKSEWKSLGDKFISNPSTFFDEKSLYVEITGTDNERYHRSTTDGVNFSEWTKGTVNARTTSSSTSIKGVIFNFVKGEGKNPPLCLQRTRKSNEALKQENANNKIAAEQSVKQADPSSEKSVANNPGMMMRPSDPCDEDPWDPNCEPPPSGDQYSPIGYFDSVDVYGTTGYISGWTFDPDNPNVSNDVHI